MLNLNRFLAVLIALAAFSQVTFADDLVRTETRVDSVWNVLGYDGTGAIVAILDRGIDYEHPDFIKPDGTSRIIGIFDMLNPRGANDPNNPYNIGTLYTKAEIDQALSSGVRLDTRDAVGHGTATAGAAGGNGSQSAGQYAGMAPDADFLIVKVTTEGAPAHGNEPAEGPFYDPLLVPIAMDYVIAEASVVGKPVVLLANFGSSGGPMDGSSDLARSIDQRFGPGKPGVVFVTGSSDDGGKNNHAAGTVQQGQSVDIEINSVGNFLRLDLWYDDTDRFDVQIISPTTDYGTFPGPVNNAGRTQILNAEIRFYHNGSDVDFYGADNNRREIFIDMLTPGTYTIRLTGASVTDGSFQASLNPSTIFTPTASEFQTFVVAGHTVWDLASAQNNITPNSYVLREFWTDIDGIQRTFPGNDAGPGNLWTGSGVGPTYDGRLGIDVSAPGNTNIAPYGQRSWFNTFRFNKVAPGNGFYGTLGAVSGAAPVVTGIIALMLDANPNLDAEQVRTILRNTARSDAFTGTTPNAAWGYGKINAYAAVQEALNVTGIEPLTDAVANRFQLKSNYPNPFNPSTTIRYELLQAMPVELQIYDTAGRLVQILVSEAIQQVGNYEVEWNGLNERGEGVSSGIYLYRLSSGVTSSVGKAVLIR
ncbi:MAG: S8 family serine peptidase [Calditrichia bacterium]